MKVLVLGGDESVLTEGTPAHHRMREYSRVFDELHIVVATREARRTIGAGRLHAYAAPGRTVVGRTLRMLWTGHRLCEEVLPDVISGENADVFGLIGYALSKRHRIPLQVQVHTDIFSPHYKAASWRERSRLRLAPFVLPRAACVRAVSRRVADAIALRLSIPHSRIRVLPIHTDSEEYRTAARSPKTDQRFRGYDLRMVSAGRFVDREKNFSLLFDVMVEVRREIPRTVLVLVGDGPDRRRYERLIEARGLETSVLLEPWRDDLPSFLKSFDLFLFPSNYEGWGRACVEAAAAGLPIVMTDVGLAGEVLFDGVNALIVPVGQRDAMTKAVLRLAAHPDEALTLARRAHEAVSQGPYRSMAEYLRAYKRAAEACLDGVSKTQMARG